MPSASASTANTSNTRDVTLEYMPMPKQQQFHSLSAKYRGFCGGWGNGKTSAGCAETFVRLMEFNGTECIIARKTRPELKSTTWRMWVNGDTTPGGWKGVPKECIRLYNRSELYMELINGSTIHGLPLDDPKKIENYNLGLFWIDQAEEVEEDIFLKFHGRLRQHNAPREGLLTFNPNGHNWLWSRFIDPERKPTFQSQYKCVEATPFDNPNLPEDYIDQFEGLPEHWYNRFVLGSHDVFVGQIFVDFNPDVHIIKPFHIPSGWERWQCYDPGIRHEGALSWVARDPAGNAYYYREVLESGQDVSWWAATCFEEESMADWGGQDEEIWRRLVGREALIRAQTDGRTVLDLMNDNGWYPEFADRDPSARISRITEYLRPKRNHPHPFGAAPQAVFSQNTQKQIGTGSPRLYVFSTCTKLLEYLPQYRWKPQRSNFTEEDSAEKPRKKDDHNIDNLGHILVAFDDELPDESVNPFHTAVGRFNSLAQYAEARELEEHFEAELLEAAERAPYSGSDYALQREVVN
jgi:phage terminase large subunit